MEFIVNKPSIVDKNKQETLHILIYSDIFHYPLTKKEIYNRGKITIDELEICLETLIYEGKIFLIEGFYLLSNDKETVNNRNKRNDLAKKNMPRAKFMTKILAHFPFIRGVFLSGSISKDCMDENSDIDFFIVTEPGRLWVSHLFCSLFRKTILLNNNKFFCCNYFLDSEHLSISDKSIYTAIEIKTLLPLYGYNYYKKMLEMNGWTNDFFPKHTIPVNNDILTKQPIVQKFLEYFLNNRVGDWIDKEFLTFSIKRRRKKLDPKFFQNPNFYTNLQRHTAKSHITDNYPDIIREYSRKIEKYAC